MGSYVRSHLDPGDETPAVQVRPGIVEGAARIADRIGAFRAVLTPDDLATCTQHMAVEPLDTRRNLDLDAVVLVGDGLFHRAALRGDADSLKSSSLRSG